MNNISLVSINIIQKENKQLLNKTNGVPILYYWDGNGDLLESIINNEDFKHKHFENLNYDNYINLSIAYFYFTLDNEEYIDNIVNLKDYLLFDNEIFENMHYNIILEYLEKLFEICTKEKFIKENEDNIENINTILNNLKNKYKDKISNKTIANWIRQQMIEDNIYNKEDITLIINKFLEKW